MSTLYFLDSKEQLQPSFSVLKYIILSTWGWLWVILFFNWAI